MKYIKYLLPLSIYVFFILSLQVKGIGSFSLFIYAFGAIPILEFVLPKSEKNLSQEDEPKEENDSIYDLLIYIHGPLLVFMLFLFLERLSLAPATILEQAGIILSFGVALGILGINIGHELGHRKNFLAQFLAHIHYLLCQYLHFLIEHNKGHHRYVATPEDPATAPKGMSVYVFVFKAILKVFRSAWTIEKKRLVSKNQNPFSFKNLMIIYPLLQISLIGAIFYFYGMKVTLCYLLAALFGIILLESINYIEHYGLLRKKNASGKYEKVKSMHSWNSNDFIGRSLLFELTRHSDHHENANRKYQILRSLKDGPQLPYGYPIMQMISLIPPLFFSIMNKRLPTQE